MPNARMLIPAAAAVLTVLSGCSHRPGGNQKSDDMHTFVSDAHTPKTITIIDTRDGEELWSVDVPVGQKLVFQFYEGDSRGAGPENPDLMRWAMYDADQDRARLRNSMAVPPADVRKIRMTLRDAPAWPEGEG